MLITNPARIKANCFRSFPSALPNSNGQINKKCNFFKINLFIFIIGEKMKKIITMLFLILIQSITAQNQYNLPIIPPCPSDSYRT